MIFSHENLIFSVLECIEFRYGAIKANGKNRNYCALSYRIESDAKISWQNKTIKVADNTLTFFPTGIDYTRECTHDHMIVIHLDIDNYISNNIQSITPNNPDRILSYFKKIHKVWTEKKTGYRYKATSLLYSMFSELCYEFSKSASVPEVIADAVEYIHKNYTDSDLKISELAHICGVSDVYFRKLFTSHFNITPKKYINRLRFEYAKSLLNNGDITIFEIAERCGFNDVKHFSTAFKRYTGYPPSKQEYLPLK